MKVIIFGSNGLIGKELVNLLSHKYEVIGVSRSSGDIQADYSDESSIIQMYEQVGSFDALISVAGGDTQFVSFDQLEPSHFRYGTERKLMGQVNLVLIGMKYINEGGSFTLSSGFLNYYPNPFSMATSPFNAFIDNFAQTMATQMPNGVRINVVSPSPVVQELQRGTVTPQLVSESYIQSAVGNETGKVYKAWNMD